MPEYHIKPENRTLPSSQDLVDDLAKRGWKVDAVQKGTEEAWEALRICKPGPPEDVECFLLHDPENGIFTVSLPAMPANGALQLQYEIVDSLLHRLGGSVADADSEKILSQDELDDWGARFHPPLIRLVKRQPKEALWLLFAWVVAIGGVAVSIWGPEEKRLAALLVSAPAFLSALGLTYAGHKN